MADHNEINKQNTNELNIIPAVDPSDQETITNKGQEKEYTNPSIYNSSKPKTKRGNIQNLRPVQTKEQARERGRAGGLKSGEIRRQKKTMRETLENALKMELSERKLKELGADTELMNGEHSILSAIVASAIREAINGDIRSLQMIRDTIGEQPTIKTENKTELITPEDLQTIDNLRKYLTG